MQGTVPLLWWSLGGGCPTGTASQARGTWSWARAVLGGAGPPTELHAPSGARGTAHRPPRLAGASQRAWTPPAVGLRPPPELWVSARSFWPTNVSQGTQTARHRVRQEWGQTPSWAFTPSSPLRRHCRRNRTPGDPQSSPGRCRHWPHRGAAHSQPRAGKGGLGSPQLRSAAWFSAARGGAPCAPAGSPCGGERL